MFCETYVKRVCSSIDAGVLTANDVGHALYPYKADVLPKAAYVNSALVDEHDENFVQMIGTDEVLRDGVVLSKLNLMLEPSMKFGDRGPCAMELDGTCLSLSEVRQHFKDIELIQYPRSRSLQETTVWSVNRFKSRSKFSNWL